MWVGISSVELVPRMGRTLKVLVIGGGGREHALCWALGQSDQVSGLICAPGNAGIAELAAIADVRDDDIPGLIDLARREHVDLTVVGPEQPLAAGIADEFAAAGLRIFGPSSGATRLESSKVFAKEFMRRHAIPTAPFRVFDRAEDANRFLSQTDGPMVVKADGLAAGKGVIICQNRDEALSAVKKIMVDRAFGAAGERVLVEGLLVGEEMSLMAFSDGSCAVPMVAARDYKRALDGDQGLNTGGMGAYAPSRPWDDEIIAEVMDCVLTPAVTGMREEGHPYVGVLYAGMMLTDSGPRALEFNCRFGDPETQVVLPLLKTDLVDIMGACLAGRLDVQPVQWHDGYCAGVIMAARGYPGRYESGVPIEGDTRTARDATFCFHAGTTRDSAGRLVSSGGRILGLFARSSSHEGAIAAAYAAVERVSIKGAQYRTDIGVRTRSAGTRLRRPEARPRR